MSRFSASVWGPPIICSVCRQWAPAALTLCHNITGKAFQLFLLLTPLSSIYICNHVNLFNFLDYVCMMIYPPLKVSLSVGPCYKILSLILCSWILTLTHIVLRSGGVTWLSLLFTSFKRKHHGYVCKSYKRDLEWGNLKPFVLYLLSVRLFDAPPFTTRNTQLASSIKTT